MRVQMLECEMTLVDAGDSGGGVIDSSVVTLVLVLILAHAAPAAPLTKTPSSQWPVLVS